MKFKCEVRKRMVVEAGSKQEAREIFIDCCKDNEFEPKVKRITQAEQLAKWEKKKLKKRMG